MKKSQRRKDYEAYLKTAVWKQKRQVALEHADHKCQLCSCAEDLQVHHNTYKNFKNEPESDLVVLCKFCHQNLHDIMKLKDISRMIYNQFIKLMNKVKTKNIPRQEADFRRRLVREMYNKLMKREFGDRAKPV